MPEHRMTRINSPLNDPRPRWRGTGFDIRPGAATYIVDGRKHSVWRWKWFSREGEEFSIVEPMAKSNA